MLATNAFPGVIVLRYAFRVLPAHPVIRLLPPCNMPILNTNESIVLLSRSTLQQCHNIGTNSFVSQSPEIFR